VVFRSVIVCHIVPGSEGIVGDVFRHYDAATRPQDLGVVGRVLLSCEDLYIHVIERKEDPAVSGQRRGLPAFQKIAEVIGPYVTPYPRYWTNPSDSVAHEFYRWVPDGAEPAATDLTVGIGRIKVGAEPDVARIVGESDAEQPPAERGVAGRWLHSIDDLYVHLVARDAGAPEDADAELALTEHSPDLGAFLGPYRPDRWDGPQHSTARVFYRWRPED
jgi:cyclase